MESSRRQFFAVAAASLLAVPALVAADDRYDRDRDRDRYDRDRADRDRYDRDRADRERSRRRERWEKLGERTVGRREELDVIELNDKRRYTAVWFQCDEGTLEVDKIKLTFGNKETFTPETRLIFREGERTPLIDLPNSDKGYRDREIVKIGFRYKSLSRRPSTIIAWGRVYEGPERR